MQSKATTVAAYLAELPAERRGVIEAVRNVIRKNLDKPFAEGMQYGMIGYYLPHSVYPAGYHCDPKQPLTFAGLAAQKNFYAVYMMCLYQDTDHHRWFVDEWKKTGKKLDMGKSCLRFKKLEDVSLELIGQAIARISAKDYVDHYEAALVEASVQKQARAAKKSVSVKKAKATPKKGMVAKKKAVKKAVKKKPTSGKAAKKK
jgi:hypothetical protein